MQIQVCDLQVKTPQSDHIVRTGKTLGAGSYSVVKECVHIDTGRYYAAKVINKRLMAGREHMVGISRGLAAKTTRMLTKTPNRFAMR